MSEKSRDQLAVDTIRALSMDAVQAANSGHPGTPMALAPLGWTIFDRLRRHDPMNPALPDRDRFILSCGHASMLQYSLLHLQGYELPLAELKDFRQWDSKTPGHPEYGHTVGVEITTGPLGQGFSTGVGMAMAERHLAARFNREGHQMIDHKVWVIASDGDLMEGVAAEAASLAGHLELGKLIVFWDDNSITIDGRTDITFTEDVVARFAAYGWHTQTVTDGNDLDALEAAARNAEADSRPSFIQVKTIIGFPSPGKQDQSAAHGAPLGDEEISRTRAVMGWPNEAFHVPAEAEGWQAESRERGAAFTADWDARLTAYQAAHPELAAELTRVLAGTLPDGWDADLPTFEAGTKVATRKASGQVLTALAGRLPELVGGSADLAGSNNSYLKGEADFVRGPGEGVPRNVHWGIREHAMGAALNGMSLHGGVRPYGATFLIFSDYMRPAIRLASLMDQRPIYIFTHDSIGVGEDGPTHQPVEQLAALRAIPGVEVWRPADGNETRACWTAMITSDRPCAIALTRQGLPNVDRNELAGADAAHRGGYVLSDAEGAQLVFIATGSEVQHALEAQAILAGEGIASRVVSMPCQERFLSQDADYQDEVIPPELTARVVVEAGTSFGWHRFAGSGGGFVTMDRFGASAPGDLLMEKFGFTGANVADVARGLL